MIMNIEALFFRGLAIEINFFFRTAYKGDPEISQQCNQFKHGFFRFVMRAANFWCVQLSTHIPPLGRGRSGYVTRKLPSSPVHRRFYAPEI